VTRATITGLVDTLERDGLVSREHDSGDRRMMLVHLSAKGRAAIEEILPLHFKRMTTLMSPLTENERKTLVRLLNKVAAQAAVMAADSGAIAHAHSA
jgi:DNA-binding MarR family transcriptional regulator